MVARFPTGDKSEHGIPVWRYEAKVRSFIAEDTTRDLTKQPLAEWIYEGHLAVEKYPVLVMSKEILEFCENFRVDSIAYDSWSAQPFAESLDQEGINVAPMTQSCRMFNAPISELMQAIRDGRFMHDGDPLLRWCAGNAVLVENSQKQVMFSKKSSKEKIDPIVGLTMGFWRAEVAQQRSIGNPFVS